MRTRAPEVHVVARLLHDGASANWSARLSCLKDTLNWGFFESGRPGSNRHDQLGRRTEWPSADERISPKAS